MWSTCHAEGAGSGLSGEKTERTSSIHTKNPNIHTKPTNTHPNISNIHANPSNSHPNTSNIHTNLSPEEIPCIHPHKNPIQPHRSLPAVSGGAQGRTRSFGGELNTNPSSARGRAAPHGGAKPWNRSPGRVSPLQVALPEQEVALAHLQRGDSCVPTNIAHTERCHTRTDVTPRHTQRHPPPAAAAAPGHCPARARSRRHRSAPPPPPPRGPGAVRGRERRPRHLPVRPSRVSHLSQVRRSPSELRGTPRTLRTLGLP